MLFFVDNNQDTIERTGKKAAIVSMIVGGRYQKTWMRLCKASWEKYAEDNDLDIIIITNLLDKSNRAIDRSPAWQKLLILNQHWSKQYDQLIWLDSDIIISQRAQNILNYAKNHQQISASLSGDRLSTAERQVCFERLYGFETFAAIDQRVKDIEFSNTFRQYKIEQDHNTMVNTGVLVVSPHHHSDLFLRSYEYDDYGILYEQPCLSHEIVTSDILNILSPLFNWGVFETLEMYWPTEKRDQGDFRKNLEIAKYLIRRDLDISYFLHFYGAGLLMASLSYDDVFSNDFAQLESV